MIVQHPETVGHGPQLFQTFTVHQSSVTKVCSRSTGLSSGFFYKSSELNCNVVYIHFINLHANHILQVTLSEKYLVSVCSEYNHVRSWAVTRFRGMISTQPGSTPEASFKIVSLEAIDPCVSYNAGNDFGTL